ncbi:MAG TPA: Nif11-like leader peptide family RiPP precursor [Thermoanaerobaculia bacterium]
MSRADVDRLVGDLHRDPSLAEELRLLWNDPEGALQWTRRRGYDVTSPELEALAGSDRELGDDELERVAGGDAWPPT